MAAADIKQCKECRKLFHSLGSSICPECSDEMDRRFVKVRDYIYAHPAADVAEIVEKTKVPEKDILRFLREERLVLSTVTGLLNCERCLSPIASGKFCENCKAQLLKAFTPPDSSKRTSEKERETQAEPKADMDAKDKAQKRNDRQGVIYSRYRH